MTKTRLPIENVEYTFRFPPKRQLTYRWFGDRGKNGRLLLWCITGKYYTSMTPECFSYFISKRLVSRVAVQPSEETPKATPKTEKPKEEPTKEATKLDGEILEFVKKTLAKLEKISQSNRNYVRAKFLGKREMTVEQIITDFNYALKFGISDDGFNALMSRYVKIDAELNKLLNKLGGAL